MPLPHDAIEASGGLTRWRKFRQFTVHMSLTGTLPNRSFKAGLLKDIVVLGSTRRQSVDIIGFTAPDRRGVYRPDRVAMEDSTGARLCVRLNPKSAVPGQTDRTQWDSLQLVHYCGYSIWNYMAAPFMFAGRGFEFEELAPSLHGTESWRRLRVAFPARIATHGREQLFYFDEHGLQRRMDFQLAEYGDLRIVQSWGAHYTFSGITIPTLRRTLQVGPNGRVLDIPALLDMEIFDAQFE